MWCMWEMARLFDQARKHTPSGKEILGMEQVRRGTLVILIVMVLAVALVWYYFSQVYEGTPSTRGTLVEQEVESYEHPGLYQTGQAYGSI